MIPRAMSGVGELQGASLFEAKIVVCTGGKQYRRQETISAVWNRLIHPVWLHKLRFDIQSIRRDQHGQAFTLQDLRLFRKERSEYKLAQLPPFSPTKLPQQKMSDSEHLFPEVDAENLSSPSPPASPSMDTANDAAPASSEPPTIVHYTESSTSARRYSTLGFDSTSPGFEEPSDADIEDDGDDDVAPPTPNPPKRGRPKKAATDSADTTTPPKKRGRKPKLDEDGKPIAKKPRVSKPISRS
jgi:hypothetical protein